MTKSLREDTVPQILEDIEFEITRAIEEHRFATTYQFTNRDFISYDYVKRELILLGYIVYEFKDDNSITISWGNVK